MVLPKDNVCDRCERPAKRWLHGRAVVADDGRGLCPLCLQTIEDTGATVDVQWFPGNPRFITWTGEDDASQTPSQ